MKTERHERKEGKTFVGANPGRMEATHTSFRVCVCNLWSHKAPFGVLPFTAEDQARYSVAWSMKLAMYLRIWKWDAISTYLLHYF